MQPEGARGEAPLPQAARRREASAVRLRRTGFALHPALPFPTSPDSSAKPREAHPCFSASPDRSTFQSCSPYLALLIPPLLFLIFPSSTVPDRNVFRLYLQRLSPFLALTPGRSRYSSLFHADSAPARSGINNEKNKFLHPFTTLSLKKSPKTLDRRERV